MGFALCDAKPIGIYKIPDAKFIIVHSGVFAA